jgi:IS605 OrfB family transposase
VNDKTTLSLIIDSKPFKHYNAKFNRLLSKLNESKSQEVLEWGISKTGTKYPIKYTQKGKDINKFISFLYSKRNKYFYDQFHKVSKRIVEYLHFNNVTDLYLSKNLAELKNNGECSLRKTTKQNFIQIPFIKLLKNIEYKAQELGINIYWIDESYSSKSSCISDDIISIQLNKPNSTNAFNGRRVERGLFLDTLLNKIFNADINGAVNHIKIATAKSFEWLKNSLYKLCNPIKIKSDYEFCKLLKTLQNSLSGKSVLWANQSTEASVSTV